MVNANAVPPVAKLYHCKAVPVATKLETVAELLKVCAEAVGAGVEFIVTETKVLELSHEFNVCET